MNENYLNELQAMLSESGVNMEDMAQDAIENPKSSTDVSGAPKTKRGRKPKAEPKEPEVDALKPKRGRKPKAAVPASASTPEPEHKSESEPVSEPEVPIVPPNLFAAMVAAPASEQGPTPDADRKSVIYGKMRDIQDAMSNIMASFQKYSDAQIAAFNSLRDELTELEAEIHGKQ